MSRNTKILLTIAVIAIALWYFGREKSKRQKSSDEENSSNENNSSNEEGSSNEENSSGSSGSYSERNPDGEGSSGYDFEPFPGGVEAGEEDDDDQDDVDQDDYDEDEENSGFGESPIQPSFDPDDDPSNVHTNNWSDPSFPADFGSGSVISQQSYDNNGMQIVNPMPIYNGSIESYNQNMALLTKQPSRTGSTGTLQSKGRRGSGSVGTLQNKGRRGSGSTGTLQNKGRRNQTTQTGWTFATMLERIFS